MADFVKRALIVCAGTQKKALILILRQVKVSTLIYNLSVIILMITVFYTINMFSAAAHTKIV